MESQSGTLLKRKAFQSVLIDVVALSFIYFVPTLSHVLNFPLYLIEPMRLMLVIAIVHSSKKNAYLIALTMPLFSFLISSHPAFYKMLLISFELGLNVFIFYLLIGRVKSVFGAFFLSIVLSKFVYYTLKFGFISFALIGGNLVSTPLIIQLITLVIYSIYSTLFFNREINS